MAPTSPVTNDDQWGCTLSATPDPIRAGDRLTLKVTLTNRDFDSLPAMNNANNLSRDAFNYSYSSSQAVLNGSLPKD